MTTTTATNGQRISIPAAGLYLASVGYAEALRTSDPARVLDTMCGAVAEIMPDLCKVGAAEDGGELLAATTVRLRAYAAIEHARADAGDGYGYVFDLLAESLERGGDPDLIRTAATDAPGRIRALAEPSGQCSVCGGWFPGWPGGTCSACS
ncbi:hypothetical protein ACF09I_35570 [Streptomyces sp. NPDC014940]|uniref:hypothetical protein n=1 Tax=Streptomyces sp. NPDC014940 TaxID=3364932 RepID=UPI0036F54A60